MQHLGSIVATSLIATTLSLSPVTAQPDQTQQERYDTNRGRDQVRLLDRIQIDLDRCETLTLPLTPDRIRILKAREAINTLERKMNAGADSRRYLDDAVAALQHIADSNRNLSDADRDYIAEDLSRLRDYQSWMDGSQ